MQTVKTMLESIGQLQRLEDLRRAVLQVNSFDEFKTHLASNGSWTRIEKECIPDLYRTISILYGASVLQEQLRYPESFVVELRQRLAKASQEMLKSKRKLP